MTKQRNNKITNSQFILCILIVLIHSSCLFMHVPGNQELQMVFGANWASFVQLFIGEGICRIAVPLFMVISGYLFYLTFDGSWKSYGSKLKRRVFSLVIPYLFWSTIMFVAFFCAQRFFGLLGSQREYKEQNIAEMISTLVLMKRNDDIIGFFINTQLNTFFL